MLKPEPAERRLAGLLGGPDPDGSLRATQFMMAMRKLDIAELQKAYDGVWFLLRAHRRQPGFRNGEPGLRARIVPSHLSRTTQMPDCAVGSPVAGRDLQVCLTAVGPNCGIHRLRADTELRGQRLAGGMHANRRRRQRLDPPIGNHSEQQYATPIRHLQHHHNHLADTPATPERRARTPCRF